MIKAKHFKIHELVPPAINTMWGENAWMFLDPRLIVLIDAMREEFGRATINNYRFGGNREWSGLRTPDSPWYRPTSQHSFGRAADILFNDVSAPDVRKSMLANQERWLAICPSITLENVDAKGKEIMWTHVDVRNGLKGINLVRG
jgi:hypothetical protein